MLLVGSALQLTFSLAAAQLTVHGSRGMLKPVELAGGICSQQPVAMRLHWKYLADHSGDVVPAPQSILLAHNRGGGKAHAAHLGIAPSGSSRWVVVQHHGKQCSCASPQGVPNDLQILVPADGDTSG